MRFDSVTHGPLCLDIPTIDDDILEESETFLVEIKKEDVDQGFLVSPATGGVAIDDNDSEWHSVAACGSYLNHTSHQRNGVSYHKIFFNTLLL